MTKSLVKIVRNESIENLRGEINELCSLLNKKISGGKIILTESMILEKLDSVRQLISRL